MYEIKDCPVPSYQNEDELNRLIEIIKEFQPKRILEIGSLYGGTLWYWMNAVKGVKIVSVDIGTAEPNANVSDIERARIELWPEWQRETKSTIIQIRADSTLPETVNVIKKYAPFDFIFIDGGHTYGIAMADWQNYWPMLSVGGLLAFHDIAYSRDNPECGVRTVWREVRNNGKWQEIVNEHNSDGWCGIGVMWKE